MTNFSERNGFVPAKMMQIENMDEDLRNLIYNEIIEFTFHLHKIFDADPDERDAFIFNFCNYILKIPIDEFSTITDESKKRIREKIKSKIMKAEYYFVFDLIEDFCKYCLLDSLKTSYIKKFNKIFERKKSAYRFVNDQIVHITNKEEIEAVEQAANAPEKYSGANKHIKNALRLYAVKPDPNYPKVIQESISALESIIKQISKPPANDLGDAINNLTEAMLHPRLKDALHKFWAYTNAKDVAARHGSPDGKSSAADAEARFMLVSCSAFTNYLIAKAEQGE